MSGGQSRLLGPRIALPGASGTRSSRRGASSASVWLPVHTDDLGVADYLFWFGILLSLGVSKHNGTGHCGLKN
jgi:hypothetical protein